MKIYAISGTDTGPSSYWAWAAILGVTAAIFIATLRINGGARGTS
jgi:hypothetical protein